MCFFNILTSMMVTSRSPGNRFQYQKSHQLVGVLYCLYGGSVFTEWNNIFPTTQLGQERFMTFVRATRVSHGPYRKGSDFFSEWWEGHRVNWVAVLCSIYLLVINEWDTFLPQISFCLLNFLKTENKIQNFSSHKIFKEICQLHQQKNCKLV